MIRAIKKGKYEIVETKYRTKLLYLDENAFAWIHPKNIGEILVSSHHVRESDVKVSQGVYILYDVVNEDALTDLKHLELEYSPGKWQGYLLPTGLPRGRKIRAKIIPTNELVSSVRLPDRHALIYNPPFLVGSFRGKP